MTKTFLTSITWKSIKLGNGLKSGRAFCKSIKKADCIVGVWGNAILNSPNFTASSGKREIELVLISVAELGYEYGAAVSDIYERAQERGLKLCPPEVGPHLRMQYADQPKGEKILIAMEPIFISFRTSGSFSVLGRTDLCDPALDGIDNRLEDFWDANSRWVFLSRK